MYRVCPSSESMMDLVGGKERCYSALSLVLGEEVLFSLAGLTMRRGLAGGCERA